MMSNIDNNANCESQRFEVVENGPDSHDYVIKAVKGESSARTSAAIMQERYAYLGYGYTIRQVA